MNGEIKWCKRGIVFDDDGKKYMAVVYNNRTTEKVAYEPGKIIINNSGMTLSGIIEANEIINSFISEDISSDESSDNEDSDSNDEDSYNSESDSEEEESDEKK